MRRLPSVSRSVRRTVWLSAKFSAVVVGLTGALFLSSPARAANCGAKKPCKVENGTYHVRMPADWDGHTRVGAVIYMHGWRGTARGVMRFKALNRAVSDMGLALVAPQGLGKSWSYPSSPSSRRDEFAFFDALLEDLPKRFAIDPERLIASGFSLGGSMTWYLACYRSDRFAGFVPIAGGFWRPHPASCPGPAPNIVHVHGTSDRTVPLTGRPIGSSWAQGNVPDGMAYWRQKAHCKAPAGDQRSRHGRLQCATYSACASSLTEICLHPGGHSVRPEWLSYGVGEIVKARGW